MLRETAVLLAVNDTSIRRCSAPVGSWTGIVLVGLLTGCWNRDKSSAFAVASLPIFCKVRQVATSAATLMAPAVGIARYSITKQAVAMRPRGFLGVLSGDCISLKLAQKPKNASPETKGSTKKILNQSNPSRTRRRLSRISIINKRFAKPKRRYPSGLMPNCSFCGAELMTVW